MNDHTRGTNGPAKPGDDPISAAKRAFWAQLDDQGRQEWLAFYKDCGEILGGQFVVGFEGEV